MFFRRLRRWRKGEVRASRGIKYRTTSPPSLWEEEEHGHNLLPPVAEGDGRENEKRGKRRERRKRAASIKERERERTARMRQGEAREGGQKPNPGLSSLFIVVGKQGNGRKALFPPPSSSFPLPPFRI